MQQMMDEAITNRGFMNDTGLGVGDVKDMIVIMTISFV